MKSYHESELTDLVQKIENQAVIDALDKVVSQLNRKADIIENLLYSDEARCIYNHSSAETFNLLYEQRKKLQQKQRTIYETAGIIYDIQSRCF